MTTAPARATATVTGPHGPWAAMVAHAPEGSAALTPEARRAEEHLMPLLGQRPAGTPDEASLQRVAARVVALTERASGELLFVAGPIEVVPGDVAVGGRLRLGGASGVDRRPGDLVFSGELLMTGKRSLAVLRLPGGALVFVAPASAVLWWRDRDAERHHRLRLMAGKIACVAGRRESASQPATRWTLYYPGGELESEGGDAQLAVRSPNATQIEGLGGTLRIVNPRGEATLARLERVIASAIQAPVRQPVSGHANLLGWVSAQMTVGDLPPEERTRVDELLRHAVPTAALESEKAVDEEDRRRRRRRWILAGVAGGLLLGGGLGALAWLLLG